MSEFFLYNDADISMHYKRDNNPCSAEFIMHTHENYELFYFAGGKGTYKIEGSRYQLQAGDILLMRPAEAHYIEICEDYPYTRLSLNFNPGIFSAVDRSGKLFAPFNEREPGKFNLYRENDFKTGAFKIYIRNILIDASDNRLQILSNLLPLLNEIASAFKGKTDEYKNDSLDYRIVSYINENLSQPLTLDEICRTFFISKPQLCRIFKTATGSTVWDYITVKRLVSARHLIQSGIPPTKAFSDCGFNDYSVFYRAYKKIYGVSPSDTGM